jgi:hypothetical protein
VPIRRAKFVAYTLSGLLASVAGLFLTFITYTGEASAANGGAYTLYSIASVVLGGVSLFGGSGSAIGAIFGALMFRTIGDLLFVFNVEPFVAAVVPGHGPARGCLPGLVRLLRIRNRLDLYGGGAGSRQPARQRVRQHPEQLAPPHRPRIAWAFGCIVLVLLVGSLYSRSFLSPEIPPAATEGRVVPRVIRHGMMVPSSCSARSTCRCRGSSPSAA